jgi:hypothetical protein
MSSIVSTRKKTMILHTILFLATATTSKSIIQAFKQRVGLLNHQGDGPYCLGAIDHLALEASFRTAADHEPFKTLRRPTIVASTPGAHAEWLAAHLRRSEPSAHITLSEYPFHEHVGEPLRIDNETNYLYVLRDPFSAYATYRDDVESLPASVRAKVNKEIATIDDYVEHWRRSAIYWTTHHDARVIHYEHLLVDPMRALRGVVSMAGQLDIGEHETPSQALRDEPPRLTRDGRCGRALIGYTEPRVRELAKAGEMARFGYSVYTATERTFTVRAAKVT